MLAFSGGFTKRFVMLGTREYAEICFFCVHVFSPMFLFL